MKFSEETIKVLKTFSTINTNLFLKPGNKLSTCSQLNTIRAEVAIPESFPCEFGIYNLGEFLGVLSLFSEPDVEFTDKVAYIREGRSAIRFLACEPSLLIYPDKKAQPGKVFTFPETYVEFDLTGSLLNTVIKTAGVLKTTDITIEGDGKNIFVSVADLKNPSSNSFRVEVGESDKTFTANLKVENLKMATVDYTVSIAARKISRWKSKTQDAVYYVALEDTSKIA